MLTNILNNDLQILSIWVHTPPTHTRVLRMGDMHLQTTSHLVLSLETSGTLKRTWQKELDIERTVSRGEQEKRNIQQEKAKKKKPEALEMKWSVRTCFWSTLAGQLRGLWDPVMTSCVSYQGVFFKLGITAVKLCSIHYTFPWYYLQFCTIYSCILFQMKW